MHRRLARVAHLIRRNRMHGGSSTVVRPRCGESIAACYFAGYSKSTRCDGAVGRSQRNRMVMSDSLVAFIASLLRFVASIRCRVRSVFGGIIPNDEEAVRSDEAVHSRSKADLRRRRIDG